MKKRLLSLLLILSLTLSLLPGTAMAAVSGLLDNTPEQNQDLLEQLENFNGENYEEAYDLLDSLGLLDQDGDLITDQAIVLDGEEYTLEEIEALLDDPDTDLSRTGYVDGTPIALGDLKTIIAIERELARIREKYFSDRTFEGEAVDNLNDLMDQLQTSGISLQSGDISQPDSGVRVADMTHMDALTQGDGYVSAHTSFSGGSGETFTVTAAYEPGLAGADSATVTLGSDTATLTAESPTATLTHTASSDDEAVDLSVRLDCSGDAPRHVYGDLCAAVHFTEPQGFVFQYGDAYTDAYTVRLYRTAAMPDLSVSQRAADPIETAQTDVPQQDFTEGLELALDQEMTASMLELVDLLYDTKSDKEGFVPSYRISMKFSQNNDDVVESGSYLNAAILYEAFDGKTELGGRSACDTGYGQSQHHRYHGTGTKFCRAFTRWKFLGQSILYAAQL